MEKQQLQTAPSKSRMSPSRSSSSSGSSILAPSKSPPPTFMGRRSASLSMAVAKGSSPASSVPISPSVSLTSSVVSNGSSPLPRRALAHPAVPPFLESIEPHLNENVMVTVRFRPLSMREIQRGDDVAWYADGDTIVRMESNARIAYAFDRVFGPATTTRGVYDIAAQPIVNDAMEGINGTVFAYGVTSSGKTHTMHGDQKSPGVIPLAVKEVFSIIQETPGREFLLRVSYLEIYNEVINDLLNPAGQNLRIREDSQVGTYVESIKEEVVLSAAHALSLIAAGEEHRHVGSTNFNMMSSRSHTIFTMTIESTGRDKQGFEEVTLSQLNLIDLAGSESSKAATTGLRRKEGAYINKSLLTLGTVIAKLSEGKHAHVPYRDSKLTRLLQSSLSGNGRISLICTVTPASGTMEETHNTLKFAHRAKHVEVHAEANKIMDEKSLIKKYQKEISELKQELLRVKKGMLSSLPPGSPQEDLALLREKLEADKEMMQSRLEEEEQEKAALMGRIQRLTKLILVSTKTAMELPPDKHTHRRRLSFGEEDLAYLKLRKMEMTLDDKDDGETDQTSDGSSPMEETDEKKSKRRSVLSWLKLKRSSSPWPGEGGDAAGGLSGGKASRALWPGSPGKGGDPGEAPRRLSSPAHRRSDAAAALMAFAEPLMQPTQAGDLFSVAGKARLPSNENVADQIELLKEQLKILSGEVAMCGSNHKRLSEHMSPGSAAQVEEKQRLEDEIREKKKQMRVLEQKIETAQLMQPTSEGDVEEMAKTIAKLKALLSEKTFDTEIINADNRILQDSLRAKTKQNNRLLEEVNLLRVELTRAIQGPAYASGPPSPSLAANGHRGEGAAAARDDLQQGRDGAPAHLKAGDGSDLADGGGGEQKTISSNELSAFSYTPEVDNLRMQLSLMAEERDMLASQQQQLTRALAEARALAVMRPGAGGSSHLLDGPYKGAAEALPDVARLVEQLGAARDREEKLRTALARKETLEAELAAAKGQMGTFTAEVSGASEQSDNAERPSSNGDVQVVLTSLEAALTAKAEQVADLQRELEEGKQREAGLESDLATMWVLVAELRRQSATSRELAPLPDRPRPDNFDTKSQIEVLQQQLAQEHERNEELQTQLAYMKGNSLESLSLASLEELANLHQEALAKLAFFKAGTCSPPLPPEDGLQVKEQERQQDEAGSADKSVQEGIWAHLEEFKASTLCRGCFESAISTRLLPCGHTCLCGNCVQSASSCPTCLAPIASWQEMPSTAAVT